MSFRSPTASSLALAQQCAYPWTLPVLVDPQREDAREGTETHRQIALAVDRKDGEPLPTDPAALAAYEWLCEAREFWENVRAEVAYGLHLQSGEVFELGQNIGRRYEEALRARGLDPAEFVCGTVDLTAVANIFDDEDGAFAGRRVVVVDWKRHRPQGAPGESLQLLFGAYCAAWMVGLQQVVLVRPKAVMADVPPYMPPARVAYVYLGGGEAREFGDDVSELSWPAVLAQIQSIAAEVRRAQLRPTSITVRPGDHCAFCPAFMACPGVRGAALALLPMQNLAVSVALPTPELVARVLDFAQPLRRALDVAQAFGRQLAEHGALPGYELREGERETLDGAAAYGVIAQVAGAELARDVCEVKVSKTALRKALEERHGKEEGRRLAQRIVDDLRDQGDVSARPTTKLVRRNGG